MGVKRISELGATLAVTSCMLQLLVTANVIPSSLILFTPMMEAIRSSKMSVLTRTTRHHIPEDGILQYLKLFVDSTGIASFP
jgi:hypothetical protein